MYERERERERTYDYIFVLKPIDLTLLWGFRHFYYTFFLLILAEYVACGPSLSLVSLVISLCYADQFLGTNIKYERLCLVGSHEIFDM